MIKKYTMMVSIIMMLIACGNDDLNFGDGNKAKNPKQNNTSETNNTATQSCLPGQSCPST